MSYAFKDSTAFMKGVIDINIKFINKINSYLNIGR